MSSSDHDVSAADNIYQTNAEQIMMTTFHTHGAVMNSSSAPRLHNGGIPPYGQLAAGCWLHDDADHSDSTNSSEQEDEEDQNDNDDDVTFI